MNLFFHKIDEACCDLFDDAIRNAIRMTRLKAHIADLIHIIYHHKLVVESISKLS